MSLQDSEGGGTLKQPVISSSIWGSHLKLLTLRIPVSSCLSGDAMAIAHVTQSSCGYGHKTAPEGGQSIMVRKAQQQEPHCVSSLEAEEALMEY